MSANQQIQWTATVNVAGATGPLQQLQSQFGATGSSASSSQGGLNSFSNSATQSGTAAKGTSSALQPLGAGFNAVGISTKGANSAMQPLPGTLGDIQVKGGGMAATMTQVATASDKTGASSVSTGQKIGLLSGFIASTAGSVLGLVLGYK